ncbi:hypothetical protein Q8F55_008672 [Vanrija albida]|uniref:Uncharacterized protein n=1 Tax=Vanrija albida TaxID=181172 RepID=A0ABR3PRJ6_9TREE
MLRLALSRAACAAPRAAVLPAARAISADALAHTAPKETEGPLFTGKKKAAGSAAAKPNDTGDYKPQGKKGVRSKMTAGKGFDELKKRHDEGKD